MAKEDIDVQQLLDFQYSNKIMIKGIKNHFDEITSCVGLVHCNLSNLLGPFIVQASTGMKVTKKAVIHSLAQALKYTLALCSACSYEIPSEELIDKYEFDMPYDIKMDAILSLTDMMMSILDILHIVNVDADCAPIWWEEHVGQDFEDNIISIILGIKNIGKKYSFTLKEVLEEM